MALSTLLKDSFTVAVTSASTGTSGAQTLGYAFSTSASSTAGEQRWILYPEYGASSVCLGAPANMSQVAYPRSLDDWKRALSGTTSLWRSGSVYVMCGWQSTGDLRTAQSLIESTLPAQAPSTSGPVVSMALPNRKPGSPAVLRRPAPRAKAQPVQATTAKTSGGSTSGHDQFWGMWGTPSDGVQRQGNVSLFGTALDLATLRTTPNGASSNVEYWLLPSTYTPVDESSTLTLTPGDDEMLASTRADMLQWLAGTWLPNGWSAGCTLLVVQCAYSTYLPDGL